MRDSDSVNAHKHSHVLNFIIFSFLKFNYLNDEKNDKLNFVILKNSKIIYLIEKIRQKLK